MMSALKKSLAGPGYVILNAIRALNIIALLDIMAADAVLLAKISLLTSFFFFQAVTHVVSAGVCIFLIVSELPVLQGYFDRNWPLMGQDSGFITLAAVMMILGVAVLGNLNAEATSQESLGLPFWRVILSAGILSMVMSAVNVLSSFIFADRETGVSARHVRAYGAVAPHKAAVSRSTTSGSQRSFNLSLKREDSLPTYSSHSSVRRSPSNQNASRFPLKISAPIQPKHDAASSRYSRDSSGVAMPNLAHHPAMHSGHV
ncbi:hypothetical protein PHISP_02697 [Aspergillus sp. HF37]|nr:hypothetical protein PHISP_02697 [Aspergillus sp. HF37]